MKNIVVILNKPPDMSSQQAVIKVKKNFAAKKAGHAGTLDPMATGVLVVCLDEATKITRFLADLDKEYIVRMKFGERTDTFDSTGNLVEIKDFGFLTEALIQDALPGFTGSVKQTPPMYSAIKVKGQTLYKLARKGINIEVPERTIKIYEIKITAFNLPFLDIKVSCSKGTYIRSLCDDLGTALGTVAHMTSLIRSRTGSFKIEQSFSFGDTEEIISRAIYSIDSATSHLQQVVLDQEDSRKIKNGIPIMIQAGKVPDKPQYVRLKNPENVLLGFGKIEDNMLKPERLLN